MSGPHLDIGANIRSRCCVLRQSTASGATTGRSADAELEWYVVAGLHRAAVDCRPLEEAHGKAVLAAADFGIERAVIDQVDAQQAAMLILLHVVLVHAVNGELVYW